MGRRIGLSWLAVIAGSHLSGFHWPRGSGRLSASLSSESSALDKLEPPKAVTAPQYHLYVHLEPARMLLTFYKSQKHVKSTWQLPKNLSNWAILRWPVCCGWACQHIARHGIHPITIEKTSLACRTRRKEGRLLVVFCLFLSVSLAYSLSNEKHDDVSSFPPIPNIAGPALVIMANNVEENDPNFICFSFWTYKINVYWNLDIWTGN